MDRELLKEKFAETLGEEPLEVAELEVAGAKGYLVLSNSYELTVRCNEWGRCEVMLRYMDQPAVTCTTRCYRDPTSQLDRELLSILEGRVRKLIEALNIQLLSLDDL